MVQPVAFGRRLFLRTMAALALVGAWPGKVRAYFVDALFVRTVEHDNFLFDPANGTIKWRGQTVPKPYELKADGLVAAPRSFSYEELRALPRVTQVSDFHCVEGWSVADISWGGFRFAELVKLLQPRPEATYVVFHALGRTTSQPKGRTHYTECHPLAKLLDPDKQCLLALEMNGKPLPQVHGAPLRLISPFDYGYKNIKFLQRVEFVAHPQIGWWTAASRKYPIDGTVAPRRLR